MKRTGLLSGQLTGLSGYLLRGVLRALASTTPTCSGGSVSRSNRLISGRLVGSVWSDRVEAEIYERVVDACLEEPSLAKGLGKRPGATAEAMRAAMAADSNITRALAPCQESHSEFRRYLRNLRRLQAEQEVNKERIRWDWRSLGFAALVPFVPVVWVFGPFVSAVAISLLCSAWWVAAITRRRSRDTLSGLASFMSRYPIEKVESVNVQMQGAVWEAQLRHLGVGPLIPRLLEAFLGDDPDELLLPDNYEGLRSVGGRHYLVESKAADQLERKMAQIDGGTIAVCGPRGSGKSTLLESCIAESDFAVSVSAPASFTPHDFLITLFVKLCEKYIESEGYEPPNLHRLTVMQKATRRLFPRVKRLLSWASHALPAAALVLIGTFAAVRSTEEKYGTGIYGKVGDWGQSTTSFIGDVWRGEGIGAGVALTLLGLAIWRVRGNKKIRSTLRVIRGLLTSMAVVVLVALPLFTATRDADILKSLEALDFATFCVLIALFLLCVPATLWEVNGEWRKGRFAISKMKVFGVVRPLAFAAALFWIYSKDYFRAILADDDNPVRMVSILTGILIYKAEMWTPKFSEPALVSECRDHIYRLQTIQGLTNTVNSGTSQVVALGASHATSLSTVPPNFPEVVADFREILRGISLSRYIQGGRTVIAIDELDRLGTDTQALAFLAEIKAVFGVPNVHYLISVAEDVGAAFVRRGLPHRDVTDSSIDDVVHVQSCTLPQSDRILQARAPGLSTPYMVLVHALSGGLPRDLVRYGRRIMEIENRTGSVELTEISRQLILEELSETLSGFRLLLSKQQWTGEASFVLDSFRSLLVHLRADSTPHQELRRALEDFAESRKSSPLSNVSLPAEANSLIAEASAYAYYSLTLLDIFSVEGFTRRSELAANRGPEGDPHLLAEARQELAVSPYTTRSLLRSIRAAWGLPVDGSSDGSAPGRPSLPGQQTR